MAFGNSVPSGLWPSLKDLSEKLRVSDHAVISKKLFSRVSSQGGKFFFACVNDDLFTFHVHKGCTIAVYF